MVVTGQLALELEPPAANPNARFFNGDGTPRRLLWCSDVVAAAVRAGGDPPCPYEGRENPCPPCCKSVVRGAR